MNLYLISQNRNRGYDTYDSAVVAALSEAEAREIHPGAWQDDAWGRSNSTWANSPEDVVVQQIGAALPGIQAGQIVASFNAG